MSRMKLAAQTCLVSTVTRQYGQDQTSDLLGVNYYLTVPADTEFPRAIPRKDAFVRFFVTNGKPTNITIFVWWLHEDGTDRERVGAYRFAVPFRLDERVRDQPFRLANVELKGLGPYAVRVCHRRRHPWKRRMVWRVLATDYFRVLRSS